MSEPQIKFNDAAAYEEYMGGWSQLAGFEFLDWISPAKNLTWLDVGCGSGAFTQVIADRCAPAAVAGIDPEEAQITFAKARLPAGTAQFRVGDAMALPYADGSFDVAVMSLVIFFVPDPFKGVAEMARVVKAGGLVASYAWDLTGGGFPYRVVQEGLQALGIPKRREPSANAAEFDRLREFWTAAPLEGIETHTINVRRTFVSEEAFWTTAFKGPNMGPTLRTLPADRLAALKAIVRPRLSVDGAGRVTLSGRAHAIRGRRRIL